MTTWNANFPTPHTLAVASTATTASLDATIEITAGPLPSWKDERVQATLIQLRKRSGLGLRRMARLLGFMGVKSPTGKRITRDMLRDALGGYA